MSSISVNTITDASGGATTSINGFTPSVSNMAGRNRIINGDMRIDQRNNGASVTPTSSQYSLDRWSLSLTAASKFSFQQSTTAPTGFSNSMLFTSTSAYSVGASDFFLASQWIEGFNTADLMWGTANAKTVTLSFWVRSSLTGTFGGCVTNSSQNRSYPFTFTISSANTFEYKTVTIAGDTSGTWVGGTNGRGIGVWFSLGAGSTYSGTAGAWSGSNVYSATGATSVVGTSGATFYITGVQLEEGSVATPFEHRQYGQELELCRRYLQVFQGGSGSASSSTSWETFQQANPPFRATPTLSLSGVAAIEDHAVTVYTQSSAIVTLGSATALAFKYGLGNFSGLTNSRYYSLALAVNGNKLFASAEL